MCIPERISNEFEDQIKEAHSSLFALQSQAKTDDLAFSEGGDFKFEAHDLENFEGYLYDQTETLEEDDIHIGGMLDSPYMSGVLHWTRRFLNNFYKEVNDIICDEQKAKEVSQASDISMKGVATSVAA